MKKEKEKKKEERQNKFFRISIILGIFVLSLFIFFSPTSNKKQIMSQITFHDKLKEFTENPLTYDRNKYTNDRQFVWETSKFQDIHKDIYQDYFFPTSNLNKTNNFTEFNGHMLKTDLQLEQMKNTNQILNYNKYGITFYSNPNNPKPNLDIECNNFDKPVLIIPRNEIQNKKDYTYLKNFIDNADIEFQKHFWKYIYNEVLKYKQQSKYIIISTHGEGVSYLHIRIECDPKYSKRYN